MSREMKDSGIEWIGEIPKDWDTIKFKYIFEIIGGNGFPEILQGQANGDYPFCKVSDINSKDIYLDKANNYVSEEIVKENKFNIVPSNSILIAKIGEALKKNHRKINVVDCIIDNNMQALTTNENISYCYHLLYTMDMTWFDNNGTVPSINNYKLKNFTVPKILRTKQQQIANFLNERVSEIDNIIAKTTLSIEEYKRYRQSIITETVTKGLNPDVKMIDSEIEWIGIIPEHWKVNYLNQVFTQVKNKNYDLNEKNLLSLSYGKIKRKDIESNEGLLPENFSNYNIIDKGNIVLRLTDLQNDHTSLRVGLANERGIITSAYVTITSKEDIDTEFFYYFLHSFDIYKGFYGMGSGVRQGLNYDGIKKLKIIIPPKNERIQIADYLNVKSIEIENLISKKQKLISELELYKKSLIYECVTGKREV